MRRLFEEARSTARDCIDLEIAPGSQPGLWRWRFKILDSRAYPLRPGDDDPAAMWMDERSELTPREIAEALEEIQGEMGPNVDDLGIFFLAAPPALADEIMSAFGYPVD